MMATYNLDRHKSYTHALFILNLTPTERRILGKTFGKILIAVGDEATPVFEQVIFAFNDALKEGASPRSKTLAQIVRYTHTLLQFGDAGKASIVPMRTLSVIKDFYDAAKASIQHKGPTLPEAPPLEPAILEPAVA